VESLQKKTKLILSSVSQKSIVGSPSFIIIILMVNNANACLQSFAYKDTKKTCCNIITFSSRNFNYWILLRNCAVWL